MTFPEALSAVFDGKRRSKRLARAETRASRNQSDGLAFVEITILEADPHGGPPDIKRQFSLDEGTAIQLVQGMIYRLAEIRTGEV